jgi:hypothetical protein
MLTSSAGKNKHRTAPKNNSHSTSVRHRDAMRDWSSMFTRCACFPVLIREVHEHDPLFAMCAVAAPDAA